MKPTLWFLIRLTFKTPMHKLLLIDDEPVIQHAFRKAFHLPEYETHTARTAADGLRMQSEIKPDVIVLDVHLPDADNLAAFDQIKAVDSRVPIILITGHGTTDLAIEAMKRGAFDYLLKPVLYEELKDAIDRACACSRLVATPTIVGDAPAVEDRSDALVGRSPGMQEVYKAIGRVAATDTTVLILGESGTGKELIARAVCQYSKRKNKPFLAINCGAIPENLIESELFGHEKGAFTGADRKRIGKFEQCHGGTLFLDEVGEMPLLAQVKLLRVLQEQQFERVGGDETLRTDVRVIAATNSDLEHLVAAGRFRSDLYFRLNVFTMRLPPLRERGDDIELLADYYLARFARELERPVPALPPDTKVLLRSYRWPGNIRELQSVLKQAFLQLSGSVLVPELFTINHVPKTPAAPPPGQPVAESRPSLDWEAFINERLEAGSSELHADCLNMMERQLFSRILNRTGGNQVRAAEVLGITRGTLRNKLRLLGINVDRSVGMDDEPAD
ncbi:sigma-54-dependent transcriptional regulator [Zavarzinella formosa]|uniref:sigma-54-dependent transcriptional regulator n=1 Tax=Zavarzinella formosa TaxID=360055 RepID=UPI0002DDEBD8|nr:sigma-54 dependent transcriptional regulator [Zavarzinella formosa]